MALEARQPRDAGRRPRSTCGEDNSVRRVISIEGFYSEFIGIGQTHGLGGHKFDAHSLGPLDALTLQFRTRDGGGEAVVVLDKLRAVKRTRPPGEDGGVHPARAVYSAADTPAGPEPMMTILDIVGLLILLVLS